MTRVERADRARRRRAALALLGALTGGILVGSWAGATDPVPTPAPVTVTVPPWADTTAWDDERWQDESGLPYCDGSAPLYPCLTTTTVTVDEDHRDCAVVLVTPEDSEARCPDGSVYPS